MTDKEKELQEIGIDLEQDNAIEEMKELTKSKKKKDEYNYVSFFETDRYIYEQILATDVTDATEETEGGGIFYKIL